MMESLNKRLCFIYQQFLYVPQLLNDVNENMLYPVFEILLWWYIPQFLILFNILNLILFISS